MESFFPTVCSTESEENANQDIVEVESFINNETLPDIVYITKFNNITVEDDNNGIHLIETLPGEYDMNRLDALVRERIMNNTTSVPKMQKRLSSLEWIRDNTEDPIEKEDAIARIFEMKKEIKRFSNAKQLREYEKLTKNVFTEYNTLLNTPIEYDFLDHSHKKLHALKQKKLALQRNFLQIASRYAKIHPLKPQKKTYTLSHSSLNTSVCKECGGSNFEQTDDEVVSCIDCGVCIQTFEDAPAYKDKERINMSKRFRYTCDRHFREAMAKYQGKQNTTIPVKLYHRIDGFIEQNSNITTQNLTHEHIILVMGMYGYSDRYEDVWLVHYKVTGKPPPDISKYEEKLYADYEHQNRVAGDIKINDERKNSLNVYYQLCRLLQKNGYKCKLADFYCIKTDETKDCHDEVWIKRCKKAGWKKPILD